MATRSSDHPKPLGPHLEAIARLSGVSLRATSLFQWLGAHTKRIIAAFAAVATVAFTGAGVAHADDYTYVPLLANKAIFKGGQVQVLTTPVLVPFGDVVRVTGQLAVSMPGGHNDPEVDFALPCYDQYGHAIPGDPTFGSGTNYTRDNDAFQWNTSTLLFAPVSNGVHPPQATFYCGIQVSAVDYQTTVLASTPGQTTHGTWLAASSSSDGGMQWWWTAQGCNPDDKHVYGTQTIATNANDGPSKCTYLGGPNPSSLTIFQNTWSASNDATVVDFAAGGQNTMCYSGTGSCREADDGGGDKSNITSLLKIQQLDQNANPCGNATVVYSEDTTKGDSATDTRETVTASKSQHHIPVYYYARVPVSQLCGGSRNFATSLYTQFAGGDPIKFENKNLNAINLERAPTTTVPPVIGLTEQQATAAIVAAKLYTGAPNNVTSTSPPGTVLAQNAPSGTVEPVGSQVQITVSAGQTTVPGVIGDAMAAAEQAIKSAGLTPVTLKPISNCADESNQGKVQSQSPPKGAQVSPGAQVEIQTTACNR